MKKIAVFLLCAAVLITPAAALEALRDDDISMDVPSAVLMEKTTGTVIYEKNPHEKLSPASVTKVMTMLLIIEEIESGALSEDDMVTASARASSMGGSQIYLEEGEQMSVRDMLKSLAVSSANDCAVALAEHISGTEEAFVARMNRRASELGMINSNFCDCTGLLEDDAHLTTAYDIALMSRELIGHEKIKEYTGIWIDSVRGGEFGLSNTNRLIFGFDGATGLKTGFTSKAMYCLSATAERGGIEYIAVVMHAETSDIRFNSARTLLNYAFANYTLASLRPEQPLSPVAVELGKAAIVQPVFEGPHAELVEKNMAGSIRRELEIVESVKAPVKKGQQLGMLKIYAGDSILANIPVVASDEIPLLTNFEIFARLYKLLTGGG